MEPIDLRSDLLPPLIALALSVAVHLAAAWWVPSPPKPDRSEPEAVVVEMRELPAPAPPDKPKPKPRRPPKPRPKAAARARPKPTPKPQPARQPPPPQPQARPAPEPPPLVQETTAKAPARAEEPPPAPPEPEAAKPAPRLSDLLPSPREIAAQARSSGAPDPAGGAQEATLWLGQADTRYRGYLERVQNAIDVSWRWKEALLGAGRPGSVVIGFTLTPDGRAEEVKVSRSSGSPLLDEEAAAAVRRAVFPAFPAHWSIRRLRLFAQFDYRLE